MLMLMLMLMLALMLTLMLTLTLAGERTRCALCVVRCALCVGMIGGKQGFFFIFVIFISVFFFKLVGRG